MDAEALKIESDALDNVKNDFNADMREAQSWLFQINRKRTQTPLVKTFGGVEASFKASVLKIYGECRPKFRNHLQQESVKKLVEIEPRIDFKISLKDAEQVFKLLIDFFELNGLTHYEKKQDYK